MITLRSVERERLYVRRRDGLRVRAQFVSGAYTHVYLINQANGKEVVFELDEFFRDFEPADEIASRPTAKDPTTVTLETRPQFDIVLEDGLWGHALSPAEGAWLVYRINWESGDLEWLTSVDCKNESEIIAAVRAWFAENGEEADDV